MWASRRRPTWFHTPTKPTPAAHPPAQSRWTVCRDTEGSCGFEGEGRPSNLSFIKPQSLSSKPPSNEGRCIMWPVQNSPKKTSTSWDSTNPPREDELMSWIVFFKESQTKRNEMDDWSSCWETTFSLCCYPIPWPKKSSVFFVCVLGKKGYP